MKPVWKDVTSYARSEPEPRTPRAWELRTETAPVLRVIVTRKMHVPDAWFVLCYEIGIERQLGALALDAAKVEAVIVVQRQLAKWASALPRYRSGPTSEGG